MGTSLAYDLIVLTSRATVESAHVDVVVSCARERSVNVSEPESLELMVSNLKPEESYSFRVIAYNDVGPGESSAPLRITTKPDRNYSVFHGNQRQTYSFNILA